MVMLFRRWQHRHGHYKRCYAYLSADSRPQWTYDYLIIKLTYAFVNILPGCDDPLSCVDLEEHLLPFATMGHGGTGTEHKLVRLTHALRLEVLCCCLRFVCFRFEI